MIKQTFLPESSKQQKATKRIFGKTNLREKFVVVCDFEHILKSLYFSIFRFLHSHIACRKGRNTYKKV